MGSRSELVDQALRADGPATFRVALREGVEVCEHGIRTTDGSTRWQWRNDERPESCSKGVAGIALEVRDGRITDLAVEPWRGSAPAGHRDLGLAAPGAALDFLVGMASGRPAAATDATKNGMMVSGLIDGVEAWPRLLEVSRDRAVGRDVRKSALFWVGQAAADRIAPREVSAGLRAVAEDEDEDLEVRKAAVFALSQRPEAEAIPTLMEVARSAPEAEIRRSALFWLAQHDAPEVAGFFEEILSGG